MHDYQTGQDTVVNNSGQTIDLGIRPKDHSSHFSIGDPKYTLSLLVTPGIDARLFVDIAVWSHNWELYKNEWPTGWKLYVFLPIEYHSDKPFQLPDASKVKVEFPQLSIDDVKQKVTSKLGL